MGNTAALYLSELWHNDSGFALSTSHTSTIGANTYTADIVNAAFQLAIWKLEYDAGTNAGSAGLTNADAFATAGSAISANTSTTWTTGNLRATGDANIIGLATYMLNHLAAVDATNEDSSLWALVSPAGQDQLFGNEVPTPNVNSNPVPEPASMVTWLLLGSVAGFAGMRRRRKIAA
jgi:hypothetical protein